MQIPYSDTVLLFLERAMPAQRFSTAYFETTFVDSIQAFT